MSAIIAAAGALVSWLVAYFSDGAKLHRREMAEADRKAEERVESERLKAAQARIDREPTRDQKAALAELKRRFGGRP